MRDMEAEMERALEDVAREERERLDAALARDRREEEGSMSGEGPVEEDEA